MKVLVAAVAVLLLGGCSSGGADDPKVRAAADDLITTLGLDNVDGPNKTTSKSISYLGATGTASGSTTEVSTMVERVLVEQGWEMRESDESRFVASRDGVATQVAVHSKLGSTIPPDGTSFVQLSVAEPTDGLGWTQP